MRVAPEIRLDLSSVFEAKSRQIGEWRFRLWKVEDYVESQRDGRP